MRDDREIRKQLGISYLRPYQELTITHILEIAEKGGKGRTLCSLPTGSGKSLCFMYPIAYLKKRSIIVYPLLSLMNDQAERFGKAGIPFYVLKGGMDRAERNHILNSLRKEPDAAVITNPETLINMRERGELPVLYNPELMVIDEAHTAVTWGERFRESYLSLPSIIEEIRPKSVLAFTATMDERIEKGIIRYLFSGITPYIVRSSTDRENIFYHGIESLSKLHDTIKILKAPSSRPAVIFCRSRRRAEETAEKLSQYFPVKHYHAGLGRNEKESIEKWFLASSDGVLSSTSAYGLGVDKKNVRTVIHTYLPESASDFLQESGRGGRDGERMDSYVLFYCNENTPLSSVFRSGNCIRHSLLSMMGEYGEADRCLGCSACVSDGYERAGEREIIRWTRLHPGMKVATASEEMTASGLFRKGKLKGWSASDAERAIRTLGSEGAIKIIWDRIFPGLKGKVEFPFHLR